MKGRSGGGRLFSSRSNTTNNQGANAALAGGAVGALAGGASTPTLTSCASDDKTFYCRLVRFVNTIKLIITIIVIVGVILFLIWFAYSYFKSSRKGSGK